MARKPVFDFKLEPAPRVRERQEWLDVAQDSRAMGAAALENARILAIDHVEPGPWQVRRDFRADKMAELVESVRAQGVLEPILVRATDDGRYQIIAGERRYRAAQEAGLATVPALVLDIDDIDARIVSLMENIQRDDLNEIERAEGLVALKQLTGQTWEDIGRRLGVTRRHVLHLVSLTRLPESVQEMVRAGKLSAKHGRLLAYVKDPLVLATLAEMIAERHLNAEQTAEAVKRVGSEPGFTPTATDCPDDASATASVGERLTSLLQPILEPPATAVAPVPEMPSLTAGDLDPLVAGITEIRRAIAAFPPLPVEPDGAHGLYLELDALVEAARALLRRLPPPGPDA